MSQLQRLWPTFHLSGISILILSCLIHIVISEDILSSQIDDHELFKRDSPSSWWFANIIRNGTVPYGSSNWTLFRNVKDFGATGMTLDKSACHHGSHFR